VHKILQDWLVDLRDWLTNKDTIFDTKNLQISDIIWSVPFRKNTLKKMINSFYLLVATLREKLNTPITHLELL
jgi:hypothetical protein